MAASATLPEPEDVRDGMRALSSLMLAAAFVTEPGVWPSFAAFAERTTGKDLVAGPETMDAGDPYGIWMQTEAIRGSGRKSPPR